MHRSPLLVGHVALRGGHEDGLASGRPAPSRIPPPLKGQAFDSLAPQQGRDLARVLELVDDEVDRQP